MFIINITYVTLPVSIEPELRNGHIEFLDKYYESGIFLCSGRKKPYEGGVIVAKGNDRKIIQQIISEDPFNQPYIAQYEIIEFEASRVKFDNYKH